MIDIIPNTNPNYNYSTTGGGSGSGDQMSEDNMRPQSPTHTAFARDFNDHDGNNTQNNNNNKLSLKYIFYISRF